MALVKENIEEIKELITVALMERRSEMTGNDMCTMNNKSIGVLSKSRGALKQ